MKFKLLIVFFIIISACTSEATETIGESNDVSSSVNDEAIENKNEDNTPDQTTPKSDDEKINEPEEEKNNTDPNAIAKSLEILKNPSDDVIKCIDNDVFGLYEDVQNGYTPDEYEAGVVLNCFNNQFSSSF